MTAEMQSTGSDSSGKKWMLRPFLVVILALFVYFIYVAVIKPQASSHPSVVGYVTYVSPAGYSFLIISSSSSTDAVSGTLPSMDGFPLTNDPDYQYIGDAGYKGTLPNIGDKVSVKVEVDDGVQTDPPYSFSTTTESIDVLLDAQFNSYIKSLIQTDEGN